MKKFFLAIYILLPIMGFSQVEKFPVFDECTGETIEKHINEDIPKYIQITFGDSDGNEKVNRKSLDNFKFKDLAG
ncbi:MAG: hypothetical protein ABF260_00045 [Flavobacteriaceae bacterium]